MGPEILGVSDRLLATVMNGIYQGTLITVLVALSFRVFSQINATTRHAVWLCTLVLLVLLVVAHWFFHSRPPVSCCYRLSARQRSGGSVSQTSLPLGTLVSVGVVTRNAVPSDVSTM